MSKFTGVCTYIINPITNSIEFIDDDDDEWLRAAGEMTLKPATKQSNDLRSRNEL